MQLILRLYSVSRIRGRPGGTSLIQSLREWTVNSSTSQGRFVKTEMGKIRPSGSLWQYPFYHTQQIHGRDGTCIHVPWPMINLMPFPIKPHSLLEIEFQDFQGPSPIALERIWMKFSCENKILASWIIFNWWVGEH